MEINERLNTWNNDTWSHQMTFPETISADNVSGYVLDFGPKRESLTSVIPITVIYVLIFITGLIGNVCTCVVIARNKHMHTATNYYLFSLAISDLLLLLFGLPPELYQLWNKYPYIFGETFCIIRGQSSETSTNASILTITSFTMERYLAICHPLRAQTMSNLSRAVKIIVMVWLLGGLCAVPLAIQFGVIYKYYEGHRLDDTAECTLKNPLPHAFEVSTFVFFVFPMAVISGLYARIGIRLRNGGEMCVNNESIVASETSEFSESHSHKLFKRQSTRSIHGNSVASRRAVIKMLFAVVVAFFLCWAPFHAQRLLAIYVENPTPGEVLLYKILTYISGVTYYVSATINPILYNILSVKYRKAFKETLAQICSRKRFRSTECRYSSRFNSNSFRYEYPLKQAYAKKVIHQDTKEILIKTKENNEKDTACIL